MVSEEWAGPYSGSALVYPVKGTRPDLLQMLGRQNVFRQLGRELLWNHRELPPPLNRLDRRARRGRKNF